MPCQLKKPLKGPRRRRGSCWEELWRPPKSQKNSLKPFMWFQLLSASQWDCEHLVSPTGIRNFPLLSCCPHRQPATGCSIFHRPSTSLHSTYHIPSKCPNIMQQQIASGRKGCLKFVWSYLKIHFPAPSNLFFKRFQLYEVPKGLSKWEFFVKIRAAFMLPSSLLPS